MPRSIIAGNWKMYATSIADAHVLATTVRNGVAHLDNIDVVLCPPALWLSEIKHIVGHGGRLEIAAQNMYFEPEGAYTGEISPLMVKELAKYVIIGHSERREYFGETNFDVNEKVLAAIKAKLIPIVCVGEKKEGGIAGVSRQLTEALDRVPKKYLKEIVVAYEPIWAIGTGKNAEPEYAAKVATKLREHVHADTPILYGGSVKSANIEGYAKRPELNGVLVGGASVRAAEFVKICQSWSHVKDVKC